MNNPNQFLVLVTALNLLLVGCIALINSVLGPLGVFLYLPGLFFHPHYQILDSYRNLLSLIVTGFILDHSFNHPFGFHAFFLGLIYLLTKDFFHLGKQIFKHLIVYQICTNSLLAFLWFLFSGWGGVRFLSDLFFSTLLIIPISLWHSSLCNLLTPRAIPSSELKPSKSK